MHWCVVPTQVELAASERAVRALPHVQDFVDNSRQDIVKFGETPFEQYGQIDALCIVVKLPAVNDQPRRAGKWFGQTPFIEQVRGVILHAALDSRGNSRIASQPLDLGERLHHKTSMKMIDKISFTVVSVVPGTIRILALENEVEISLRNLAVLVV